MSIDEKSVASALMGPNCEASLLSARAQLDYIWLEPLKFAFHGSTAAVHESLQNPSIQQFTALLADVGSS
jgi:hypothetical protein